MSLAADFVTSDIFLTVACISLVLLLVYTYAAYTNSSLKFQQHQSKLPPENDVDSRPPIHFNPAPLPNKHGAWVNLTSSGETATAFEDCFIETQHGCCLPQHMTPAAQKRFMYTLPDGTKVQPRTVVDIFTLLPTKRLTIIGDSMSEQVFEGLLMQLTQMKVQIETSSDPIPGARLGRKPFPVLKRFYLPQFNATLQYAKSYRFALNAKFAQYASGINSTYTLSPEQLSFVLSESDVIVVNFGLHYISKKEKSEFHPAMTALVEAFAAERLKQNGLTKKFIIRDLFPSFSSIPNPSRPGLCSKRHVVFYKWYNRLLKGLAKKYSMTFWEVGYLYNDRADAKLGLTKTGKRDCLHFCHNVFIFEPVINGLYSVLFGLMDGQRKE
ncbi:hypothetical protein BJ741DRAFT_691068 [Chytriomyces cf. hyalinus JEL632]|nr:hypothetical protein BJ741DRAFT_691068 [Chytriomyces cf. hyalinus JEL632]